MNDEQVVEKLARRMGYIDLKWDWFDGHSTWKDWTWTRGGQHGHGLPNYLASRDALAPILAGLSEGEWGLLIAVIERRNTPWRGAITPPIVKFTLTIPPRDLARALASILEDKQ